MALAVRVGALAAPEAMVAAAGLEAKLALAPEAGAVKVTRPPSTGSPACTGATVSASGLAKAVLTRVVWLSPPVLERVKPRDSKAPMSQAAGRATPRWSLALTGTLLQVAESPASMAGEPGSRAKVCVLPP